MDVLQDPARVVRDVDPQVVLHASIPRFRELAQLDGAADDLLLELEAQDDVQVVGRLVGLDADQRRAHLVDRPVERFFVHGAERLREGVPQLGIEAVPEGPPAADEVLPQAALRFVETERHAAGQRRALERRAGSVLVEAVAALVHRGEQTGEAVRCVPRRDANVLHGEVRRERMRGEVDPPGGRVVPEGLDDRDDERLLALDRELRVEARGVNRARVLDSSGDQRYLPLLETVERRPHLGGLHALLVVVEQDVVGLLRRLEAVDVGVRELDVPLEVGQESREVGLGARLDPGRLRDRRGARDLGVEVGRDLERLLEIAARDADQAGLVGIRVEALLVRAQLFEQVADPVLREPLVGDAVERRELLGPCLRPAPGHHRLLVPAEQARCPAQVADLCQPCLQILVVLFHGVRPQAARTW